MGVIKSIKYVGKEPVYNITVRKHHNYFLKGGILSKNCDALRSFCVWFVNPADVVDMAIRKEWTDDMWEDYENARESDKELLLRKYGEPK